MTPLFCHIKPFTSKSHFASNITFYYCFFYTSFLITVNLSAFSSNLLCLSWIYVVFLPKNTFCYTTCHCLPIFKDTVQGLPLHTFSLSPFTQTHTHTEMHMLTYSRVSFNSSGNNLSLLKQPLYIHLVDINPVAAAAAKSFSRVRLCATPQTAAHQAPPSPGILQARTLEWVAISFSNARRWKVKVKSLSRVRLFATPWTAAHQAPPSMGFSRQEYWSGVPFPSPHPHVNGQHLLALNKGSATTTGYDMLFCGPKRLCKGTQHAVSWSVSECSRMSYTYMSIRGLLRSFWKVPESALAQ